MKQVQKTSIFGAGSFAVSLAMVKSVFMDVPVEDFIVHLHTLTVNQVLEIFMPLVLGTIGIIYDEDKDKKK